MPTTHFPASSTHTATPPVPPAPPTITLRGVPLHSLTEDQCVGHILNALDSGHGGWVVTPNVDILRRFVRDPAFAQLCAEADLMTADGMPLIWASCLQGTPLPERVAGSSLIRTLAAGAAQRGRSVYLLGGDPGTAETAAAKLAEMAPGLRVAGTRCPPMGFEKDEAYLSDLLEELRETDPDIVFVALGSPKQERLIHLIRGERGALPQTWWLGVGISFSYLSGDVRRAPAWMRRTGLEWFFRLCQEPRRLARRYLVDDIPFALGLLGSAVAGRIRGSGRSHREPERRDHVTRS